VAPSPVEALTDMLGERWLENNSMTATTQLVCRDYETTHKSYQ
jgi:hypothetical protein